MQLNLDIFKPHSNYFCNKSLLLMALFIIGIISLRFIWGDGMLIFMIIAFPFMLILISKLDKEKVIGQISIDSKSLILKTEEELIFDLEEMEQIKIIYIGYKGKKHNYDFIPRRNSFSGTDNIIEFCYKGKRYKFKFQINNEIEEKYLKEIIDIWDARGFINPQNISFNHN